MYCIALYCIALYCIALHCIALHCIVLYCIGLDCIALHCLLLHCIVLYCIVLYCIVLYCIVLYCIVLYCIVLYCIVLYCIVDDTEDSFSVKGGREIQELINLDMIELAPGPTPWVNPVVVVPKSGDIRLCIDMRRANEAMLRERHPILTVNEIWQSLIGSKVFRKLDLKWGYHQLELTPDSREITTFVTQ